MKSRSHSPKYKPLISAGLIFVLAVLVLLAGIFIIVAAAFNINNVWRMWGLYGLLVGIGFVITSAPLFILSNIAEDVHYQAYLQEFDGLRKARFHEQVLLELQSIEETLQHNAGNKSSYTPYSQKPQNRNPQQHPSKDSQSDQNPSRVRYAESIQDGHKTKPTETGMFDYEAQYKRPDKKQETDL